VEFGESYSDIPVLNPQGADISIQCFRGQEFVHDVAVVLGEIIVRTCRSTTCNSDDSTYVEVPA
jgi:hypothetical protein